jgi:poly(A) polymerase
MFAAGELGDHSAVAKMSGDLRSDDGGEGAGPALDHGRGGFIAGGFDAEDEAAGHGSSLTVAMMTNGTDYSRREMLPASPQAESALEIVRALRAAGYEAFLAGGCVRDLLLGRAPADYDVATSATPDVVLGMFPRTFAVGAHFGVVLVAGASPLSSSEGSRGDEPVTEVATFRSDGVYSDGRHPDAVRYTTSAAEDVERRDFTINGLLLDPLREGDDLRSAVLDYVGGLDDLEAGVVRAIGRAETRFEEDQLRLLRAVRFAARFGFGIEAATLAAMRKLAARIHAVSRERIREELTKMLTEGHARRAFELLDETDLLVQVLPEISRMKGVAQPPQFHPEGDVWIHTLMLLEQLEAGCAMTLGWGALLHDVGKPPTFRQAPDRIRFDGHVEVGVAMGAEICRRFRFSNDETQQILALIENHMRFADAPRMKASTLKRFFRLNDFPEHLALHRMDCMAAHGNLDIWEFVRERYQALPEEEVRPRPLLTGRELIAAGYRPGPQFKEMLQGAEDAQLEGLITTGDEAMALVRERFGGPGGD